MRATISPPATSIGIHITGTSMPAMRAVAIHIASFSQNQPENDMNTLRKLSAAALSAVTLLSAMPALAYHGDDDRRRDGRRYEQDRRDHGRHRGWERRPLAAERRVVVERPIYVESRRGEHHPVHRDNSDGAAGMLIGGIIGAIIGSQIMGR